MRTAVIHATVALCLPLAAWAGTPINKRTTADPAGLVEISMDAVPLAASWISRGPYRIITVASAYS